MGKLDGAFDGAAKQLQDAVEVIHERANVYGDNLPVHAETMAALFPEGVSLRSPADFARFSLINLVVVKLTRYATNMDRPHRDSIIDSINYLGALAHIDEALSG